MLYSAWHQHRPGAAAPPYRYLSGAELDHLAGTQQDVIIWALRPVQGPSSGDTSPIIIISSIAFVSIDLLRLKISHRRRHRQPENAPPREHQSINNLCPGPERRRRIPFATHLGGAAWPGVTPYPPPPRLPSSPSDGLPRPSPHRTVEPISLSPTRIITHRLPSLPAFIRHTFAHRLPPSPVACRLRPFIDHRSPARPPAHHLPNPRAS